MSPWEQSVESRLAEVNTRLDNQLKWLLIAFAAGFVALAGLILNRTDALSAKAEAISQQVGELKSDVAVLKASEEATDNAALPPCPDGKSKCSPWERRWKEPPTVGTVVPRE